MTSSRITFVVTAIVFVVAACGTPSQPVRSAANQVPVEFRHACGHPGDVVHIRQLPVTIGHDACDLRGVSFEYRNYRGLVDSTPCGGGTSNSSGLELDLDSDCNVTIVTQGPPANV
jgi:hypothetical protein